jgi:hypothetical protein
MATTTNYGWTTPDDTDLVKDGAAAIRTLGSSIDTSFVADEGDLLVGGTSDIFEALPIGAAGTILTSDGDTAEWAAPAPGGGMTLLSTTALSGSTVTISSISQSYKHLLVIAKDMYLSANDAGGDIRFNGDTASNYTFSNIRVGTTTISAEATITTELSNAFFTNPTTNTNTKVASVMMNIYRYTETSTIVGETQSVATTNESTVGSSRMPFSYAASAGITSISFITNTGTFSGGNVYIYGVN